MPDDRAETVEDVIAEMAKDGEWPPSDPRDSQIQNIIGPWRRAMKERAARLKAALERERAAVLKVAEEMDDVVQHWCGAEGCDHWKAEKAAALRRACGGK